MTVFCFVFGSRIRRCCELYRSIYAEEPDSWCWAVQGDLAGADKRYSVFVRSLSGTSLVLDVEPSCTVERVKQIIASRDGIPAENQTLYFAGRQLCEGPLADHGVLKDSTLHLALNIGWAQGRAFLSSSYQIGVLELSGKETRLQVTANTTVRQLKQMLVDQGSLKGLRLWGAGSYLEDQRTLAYYQIEKGTVLRVVPQNAWSR